jgi:aminomethyltransferase
MPQVVQIQEFHEKNGHLADFAGFNLPLWFKGIIPEALAVRNSVGMFDVSHMGRAIIRGRDSLKLLDNVTTNDVASLTDNRGQYSLICNPEGGIKDDVLVFKLRPEEYLFVYNAGNRSKDYEWITARSQGLEVVIQDVSDQVAMFAVQGPRANTLLGKLSTLQVNTVPRFGCAETQIAGVKALVTRTGYTGEDGFEVYVWNSPLGDPRNALTVWNRLLDAGKEFAIEPCGLGARDLLRLEAGLCLYGTDIDENTNPLEAKLGFVVKLHKEFIGRSKLQEVKAKGPERIRVGLVTEKRVIPRHGYDIVLGERKVGSVTSGTLSPLLNTGIAVGYVTPENSKEGTKLAVQIRNRSEEAKVVKPPFYDPSKYGYSRKSN